MAQGGEVQSMKIIAIKDMANGNESVGTMWKETKIFNHDTPLLEVLEWGGRTTNIVISSPDNEIETYKELDGNE